MEIVIDAFLSESTHCPYCLQILTNGSSASAADNPGTLSTDRAEKRRKIREMYIDRWSESSSDGSLHCPLCEHKLNRNDITLLRDQEHFKCHLCGHDLATEAYRQEAYHEQRWLPVLYALTELQSESQCRECCYLGAMARACQSAFSWMPRANSGHQRQLTKLLSRLRWKKPGCDWESCAAVQQYRTTAGEALLLM
jgi:transposase-like protein